MLPTEEIRICILNITQSYHGDLEEYPGTWFSHPMDFEEVRKRPGVQNEGEIEIEDYELPFPLKGSTRLWEINALCRIVREIQEMPFYYEMDVIQERWLHSSTEFIDNKDHICCYPVQDEGSLAHHSVREMQVLGEAHLDLMNYVDHTVIGRKLETSGNYLFMDNGTFFYHQREVEEPGENTDLHCQLRKI